MLWILFLNLPAIIESELLLRKIAGQVVLPITFALPKCRRQNMISTFVILFNFSTAAERQEF
jgi:hypothetical protein